MTQYREILRLYQHGISQRSIALTCKCSRNTVSAVLKRAKAASLQWPLESKTDTELEALLFPEKQKQESTRRAPDYEKVSQELNRNGVTLKLLWMEYCEDCRQARQQPFMYSQFCYHFQQYAAKNRATMHIPRKPGDSIEVDWAGDKLYIVDRDTGEASAAYLFVGVLPFSMYAYAEACPRMDMESWIQAHVNMFRYFGGSAVMLVPDNLKTGVDHTQDWFTPQINRIYQELAEHYNTVVMPARVRRPKDKPGAEGTVGVVSTRIIAALRNRKFFTIHELNQAIREKLEMHNTEPFTKREGSRSSVFQDQEKAFLQKLPTAPFELAQWKVATVQYNYHISVDKMQYSVPYEYIKQKVDVRLTKNTVEVFFNQNRIASHRRLYGHPGQYSTVEAHMPEEHQQYLKWDGNRFIQWAEKIGPSTAATVRSILSAHKIEQQGYRSCMGLLKLADKYSIGRLENACARALSFTPQPSYKSVKNILVTGQDKLVTAKNEKKDTSSQYGYVRGAAYYGRK